MSGAWSNDQLNSLFIYTASNGTLILSVTDQGLQMFSAVTGIRDLVVNDNGLGVYSSTTGLLLMGVTGSGMVLNAPARKFRMDTSAFAITAVPDTGAYLQMTTASGFGGLIFLEPENSSVVGASFTPASIFVDSDETVTDSRPYLKLISPCMHSSPDLHTSQVILHGQALLSATDDSFVEIAGDHLAVNGHCTVDGHDIGAGYNDDASSTSSTAALSAETVVLTISSFTFQAGRAYRITMVGGLQSSADGIYADMRVKKTSTAGAEIAEFYRFRGNGANVVDMTSVRYCRNSSGADVTTDVVLTMNRVGGAGTVTGFAAAGLPRSLIIEDCGTATQYAFANTV